MASICLGLNVLTRFGLNPSTCNITLPYCSYPLHSHAVCFCLVAPKSIVPLPFAFTPWLQPPAVSYFPFVCLQCGFDFLLSPQLFWLYCTYLQHTLSYYMYLQQIAIVPTSNKILPYYTYLQQPFSSLQLPAANLYHIAPICSNLFPHCPCLQQPLPLLAATFALISPTCSNLCPHCPYLQQPLPSLLLLAANFALIVPTCSNLCPHCPYL